MEFRAEGSTYYIRLDKGESVVGTMLDLCESKNIQAGSFQGIGACDCAVLSTYLPEENDFTHHTLSGMLEMVSLMGNITTGGNGKPFMHAHATFSQLARNGEVAVMAGHLKDARIGYTAEIILTAAEQTIGRKTDPHPGIEVWDLG